VSSFPKYLWLIPALPLAAAALSAVAKREQRKYAASLAIGAMGVALVLAIAAFVATLQNSGYGEDSRKVFNFPWFQIAGENWVQLGWVLDPLTAVMLVMVCFVGSLIFIYSVGYMAHDENFTRFFCFLSLFAAAMLGLIIANSLLLFFICWENVGLTSYLLIGFWFHKPSAAAAAKKAFITTRIGDLAFLLGMVWLYSQAGTLLFYDQGHGCLELPVLNKLVREGTSLGIAASTGIALLIFCGAIGKSGQVPLHVWLPDAMEGPTPVSALIHAATMVAAGVFLVARVYPLVGANLPSALAEISFSGSLALKVVTWVGTLTAVFAASVAVAQTDIKRILAYSTVSQLGFMMMGLGMGGVAVGMFHLITHAFFKALLFMGAGSVIHGCHEEQDIRCMGGLRKFMPVTFATYAVGMMALSGVPLFFSGFWSKDEILHAAHVWSFSHWPYYLGIVGAFLTAFYMTRQVFHVFFGNCRLALGEDAVSEQHTVEHAGTSDARHPQSEFAGEPHESPSVMVVPLVILAACSVLLGFIGMPWWPWFQTFLGKEPSKEGGVAVVMLTSSIVALAGIGIGWWLYGRNPVRRSEEPDVLEQRWPDVFELLRRKYFVDEVYDWAFVGLNAFWAKLCDWLDRVVWGGAVQLVSYAIVALSWVNRMFDEYVINLSFDRGCRSLTDGGGLMSRWQSGKVQSYLRVIGLGLVLLALFLIWGCRGS
jgi:NADH-quinone oxidoreductase subunit L